jgi:crotonobetainyl-CoA:carnitine CoA-transferase CaiB-like acyl-CoA transferase
MGPLSTLRVLDLSRILAGPTCTQLLGDLGADIIKVERPPRGDDTRSWGPPFVIGRSGKPTAESAYYLCTNRNKRSIVVDLATKAGASTIRRLVKSCDVLIENFKVGDLAKYGLSYEDLKQDKPGLVYCSITGFGQTGPNALKPGYDILAQGYGGIMSLTGPANGEPSKVGVGISDVMTGMYAAVAILAGLRHRDATGEGQHIDIALIDCQIAWLINEGTSYLLSGHSPERRGNQHPHIVPYQVFETLDGHVIVAVGNDAQFERFCEVLSIPELSKDPRFSTNAQRLENREALITLLVPHLKKYKKEHLLRLMEARGVPGGPINGLREVFSSDQVEARGMKISMDYPEANTGKIHLIGNPIKFSKTPVSYRRAPPLCGADTEAVLRELLGEGTSQRGTSTCLT